MPDSPMQGSLWSPKDFQQTVADASLLHFAGKYLEGCENRTGAGPLPRWMDEHSYACLLICQEHGDKLSHNAAITLANCRRAVADGCEIDWLDALPWDTAIEVLGTQTGDPTRGIDSLIANLTHHRSGIRGYMFELAWFVRDRLRTDGVANGLLRNVADTIGGWDVSLGLCSFLLDDEDRFWAFADEYQPDDRYADQYRDRLQTVRGVGLNVCRCSLYQLDAKIRSLIDSFAYGLRCQD